MVFVFKINFKKSSGKRSCYSTSGNRLLVFNDETADRSRRLDM